MQVRAVPKVANAGGAWLQPSAGNTAHTNRIFLFSRYKFAFSITGAKSSGPLFCHSIPKSLVAP